MKDTVYFIVISLIMVVMAYFVAFGCEKLIEKKTHVKFSSEKTKVNKLVIMAMLSAVAVVLMYFDFPLVFLAPGFYKLDFSEVPVLIGSFLLGPCAGVIIEAVHIHYNYITAIYYCSPPRCSQNNLTLSCVI